MRTKEEMMDLILMVAHKLSPVKAVAISGSRMNPNAPRDVFQDYDIVYIVSDKKPLLEDRRWLNDFGEQMIMQTPEEGELYPPSLGDRFTFLMQFTDGNRIDLTLCPIACLAEEIADEPLLTALYDPEGLLADLPEASDQAYWVQKPSEKMFQDCCNEFWWVSTYVVKGLCRNELFYATDHLYTICQKELLRMYRWLIGEQHDYQVSIGKNDKYLKNHLTDDEFRQLQGLLNFTSLENCWVSLEKTQALFEAKAKTYAAIRGFSYKQKTADGVRQYTQKWRGAKKE